jgi:hypothetical protein
LSPSRVWTNFHKVFLPIVSTSNRSLAIKRGHWQQMAYIYFMFAFSGIKYIVKNSLKITKWIKKGKSKMNIQCHGPQNTTQKTKYWATHTLLKSVCSSRVSSACSISGTYCMTAERLERDLTWKSCCINKTINILTNRTTALGMQSVLIPKNLVGSSQIGKLKLRTLKWPSYWVGCRYMLAYRKRKKGTTNFF